MALVIGSGRVGARLHGRHDGSQWIMNGWHYVARGRTRVTSFASDKRLSTVELSVGNCAYISCGCGHSVQNIGPEDCEIVGVLDSGTYWEALLSDRIVKVPCQLLANNLGLPQDAFTNVTQCRSSIIAAA